MGSPVGSDKVAEEEGEDLDDEYDEEEEEDDEDRPRKKPRHGGFILDEAGANGCHNLITCSRTEALSLRHLTRVATNDYFCCLLIFRLFF